MSVSQPVSIEIAAAMGRIFVGGVGPRHTVLTDVFTRCGYASDDPYDSAAQSPNKEVRIRTVLQAAVSRPQRAHDVVEGLLAEMRAHGTFDPANAEYNQVTIRSAQQAFRRSGWKLEDAGQLRVIGAIDLETGGRAALDEQIDRLKAATDDPGLLIGTAKELLESIAKYVLEEVEFPARANADFAELWHLARERLGLLPQQVDTSQPGGPQIRKILQSAWNIAEQVNELRGLQGTGHGRTLPTGVSAEMAQLVVREACHVAEFVLRALDRATGR